jgi:hypothetical protein
VSRRLQDTLGQARARAEAPIDSYLAQGVDVERELAPLREAIAKLKARARQQVPVRPSTLRMAVAKWDGGPGTLDAFTAREIRALCGESRIATSPAFVRAIEGRGDLWERRTWLESLIAQYAAVWRSMDTPDALERILADAVRRFSGRSARIGRWKAAPNQLFSPGAADWLAEEVVTAHGSTLAACDSWEIAPGSGLGKAVLNAAVGRWAQKIGRMGTALSAPTALAEFEFLRSELLVSKLVAPQAAGQAISAIVLTPSMEPGGQLQERVQAYVLESDRFGDPRLPANSPNWGFCEQAARDRVASWFSKQDLDFFFKVAMPEHQDVHGRRRFWERYLPSIVDCVVMLSPLDHHRLRSRTPERLQYGHTTGTNDVSAFAMRFRGATELLMIEFSQPGNALYVHDAGGFDQFVGSLRSRRHTAHVSRHLKNLNSYLAKFSHHQNWQHAVSQFLYQHGIRPST